MYFNEILKNVDYAEAIDYTSVLHIHRQRRLLNQYKNTGDKNWFSNNWSGTRRDL